MLVLPIKKKWFDMILSGEKKEEYREIKQYYDSRFMNTFGAIWCGGELVQGQLLPDEIREDGTQLVMFRNGYNSNNPNFVAKCTLRVGYGNEEWGAEPSVKYYILDIVEVVDKYNC